jgi:rhombotail lipoprotein
MKTTVHLTLLGATAFLLTGCATWMNRSQHHASSLVQYLYPESTSHRDKYPFVKSIEVIPSGYLVPEGSFANLQQLQSMFGLDVVALVSYDQIQFSSESTLSLAYLTIVGAYVIAGEKNDTRTMLDTAVYDIESRKLLFRAPGLSEIKGSAAIVNLANELRRDSQQGFEHASTNLIANLDAELGQFRARIKEKPEDIKVVRAAGYTGWRR